MCSAAACPRHWNTTSAPRSPGPCRQRVLSTTAGSSASGSSASSPSATGDRAAGRRRVDHDHRRGAVLAGEQGGEQPDHAGADDRHPPARDAVAEVAHAGPVHVGGRVQQAVGADRTHVGDVDAEQRVEVVRQRHEPVRQRVGQVGRCGGRTSSPPACPRRRPAYGCARPGRPPCSRACSTGYGEPPSPGVNRPRSASQPRGQGGVRALHVAQFGAGRDAAVQRFHPERAVAHRLLPAAPVSPPDRAPAPPPRGQPSPPAPAPARRSPPTRRSRRPARWVRRASAYGTRTSVTDPADRVDERAVDRHPGGLRVAGDHPVVAVVPDDQRVLADEQRQPVGDHLQAGPLLPAQHAGRAQRADGAGREPHGGRGGAVDVGALDGRRGARCRPRTPR